MPFGKDFLGYVGLASISLMYSEAQPMAFQGYIRFPTIHSDQIIFTAEDDLWRVSAAGGRAERLTAGVADATHACFSPDGRFLAFTGHEEGPAEVYVMPADGGPARRLTYQGDDAQVCGWRPDGTAIVYASAAGQPLGRWVALHEVAPDGGEPAALPYGPAQAIAFGPRGALVIGRNTQEPAHWKRYRGGRVGYLWIDATDDGRFARLIDLPGNMACPCWIGERIYFISDHEGIGNVYSCLPDGTDLRRHTRQAEFYARGLATDGQRLVYHAGGDLYLLDPAGTEGMPLAVTLSGTRAQRARRFVPSGKHLDSWALHPQGHALAITTRGKAFSMGNWAGAVIQHGEPDGPRYRFLSWLADDRRLVSISDTGQEPQIVVFRADGMEPPRTLANLDVGHVIELHPSPVGDLVALLNHRGEVLLVDLATETMRVVDRSADARHLLGNLCQLMEGLAWAPDGQWLAYVFALDARQTVIKLCRVATGETYQVTEPVLRDMQPAFDPAGRYLYFLSARDFDPVDDNLHFNRSFPKGVRPYLLTLRRDLRSPFAPDQKVGEEESAAQASRAGNANDGPAGKATEYPLRPSVSSAVNPRGANPPAPVTIDLEGIATRIVAFPVPEARYGRVQGTHEGVVFSVLPIEGTRNRPYFSTVPAANSALEAYHFATRKHERLVDGITDFAVTPDGQTLLYRASERLRVLKAGEKPPAESSDRPGRETGWIDLGRLKVSLQPASEWRQMYDEAWRLQREQFWVAGMGGVDWQRARARYAPLLDRIGSRAELSDLLWELQGELGASHAYEIGGAYRPHPDYRQGFLGVDWRFAPATGRYTIAGIVRGDPWNADATSPLLAPGVNAAVGDTILAINGQPVTPDRGPQQLLVNQADSDVAVLLQPADGSSPRLVTVHALADEHPARYRDWVEANRRAVHETTAERAGYIHIPDMGSNGFAEFHRTYLAEYDREGLVVDVRWNGGGIVSGLILQTLARKRLGYSFQRWGSPEPYFMEAPRGPMVALTNEHAGSDGDIFSHSFKLLGLGPLIGKRTWGGVIGIEPCPYLPLADGTFTTQPEFSFWFTDVGWGVENYGADPTIDVDNPPHAYMAGADPQLARAIAEVLRLIEERPAPTPTPGPLPQRGFPAG
jgi:tricorn protease